MKKIAMLAAAMLVAVGCIQPAEVSVTPIILAEGAGGCGPGSTSSSSSAVSSSSAGSSSTGGGIDITMQDGDATGSFRLPGACFRASWIVKHDTTFATCVQKIIGTHSGVEWVCPPDTVLPAKNCVAWDWAPGVDVIGTIPQLDLNCCWTM